MTQYIHLIQYGKMPAVKASSLKVGDKIMYNYGSIYTVTAIRNVSPQYIETKQRSKDGRIWTKRFKKDKLVAKVK